jgi:hypothetical protein
MDALPDYGMALAITRSCHVAGRSRVHLVSEGVGFVLKAYSLGILRIFFLFVLANIFLSLLLGW